MRIRAWLPFTIVLALGAVVAVGLLLTREVKSVAESTADRPQQPQQQASSQQQQQQPDHGRDPPPEGERAVEVAGAARGHR